MRRWIILLFAAVLLPACVEYGEGEGPTKDDVISGKADDSVDWCEEMGWYHDDVCDRFCTRPDPDCGADADADEDDGADDPATEPDVVPDVVSDDAPFEWETPLPDMTLAELQALVASLVTAKYEHGTKFMGWAHVDNNCFIRMRAVYYDATFGELPQYTETETAAQNEMMDRIQALESSPVHEIFFQAAGTLHLQGTFETDDAELAGHLGCTFEASWNNHYGALVYTDAGPMIVDIAFSHQPLTFEAWKEKFLPAELRGACAYNDAEALSAILNYNIMKSLGQHPALPDPPCAFAVREIFRNEDGTPFDDTDLFPYMWNDVHEMAVSTDAVQGTCDQRFYLMSNPAKVPLIRIATTSVTHAP
jgi:hypothetical protein